MTDGRQKVETVTGSGAAVPIDVWLFDLDSALTPDAALAARVDSAGLERARRQIQPGHARRALVGQVALRTILAGYLAIEPAGLCFTTGSFGKPALSNQTGEPLHFNFSHSRGTAALAVSRTHAVGIDLEHEATVDPGLPATILSARELKAFEMLPIPARVEAFHRIWARKEALLKAVGVGLSVPPDAIEVPAAPGTPSCPLGLPASFGPRSAWTLLDIPTGPGLAGAVAVAWPAAELRVRKVHDIDRLLLTGCGAFVS